MKEVPTPIPDLIITKTTLSMTANVLRNMKAITLNVSFFYELFCKKLTIVFQNTLGEWAMVHQHAGLSWNHCYRKIPELPPVTDQENKIPELPLAMVQENNNPRLPVAMLIEKMLPTSSILFHQRERSKVKIWEVRSIRSIRSTFLLPSLLKEIWMLCCARAPQTVIPVWIWNVTHTITCTKFR